MGRKLLLIYLLDLTAVIYISGILIHEKLAFIDFARKEVAGAHYIAMVRDTLAALSSQTPAVAPADGSPAVSAADAAVQTVWRAEADHGAGLKATPLAEAYVGRLQAAFERPADGARRAACITAAQQLITRVGNQSNLILDPDLNSYYTMSLAVMRLPELHALIGQMARLRPAVMDASGESVGVEALMLQGRFDAAAAAFRSDAAEAISAGDPSLRAALGASRVALDAALAPLDHGPGGASPRGDGLATADAAVFDAWRVADGQLQRLLADRIDLLRHRMWLHLGTAIALLAAILAVVYSVATSISRPLTRLASVAGRISESSDYSVRAPFSGGGEIGLLVTSFNRMLGDLARDRDVRQELVATSRAEAAQRTLVEAFPTPLFVTSIPDHRVLHANPPATPWLDGLHTDPWITCLDPAARLRYFQRMSDVGSADGFEVLWRTREGYQWALLSGRRLAFRGEDALLTTITPINQIKLLEQRLELWSKVFEASSEGIVILDADRRLLSVNQSFSRVTGWESAEVVGRTPEFLYCDRHEESFYVTLWAAMLLRGAWRGEVWFKRKGGEPFPSWLVANAVRDHDGQVTHFVLAASDISDHKASEERIAHMAHHDVLTDLPNRALCLERLRLAIQQAARDGVSVAVVYIDLDRFKQVNDTLGHHAGDSLLRSVAKRLTQAVRSGDTVCRLGGDEFLIVLSRVSGAEEARSIVVERIFVDMALPHPIDDDRLDVSFSAGIAVFPHDGRDVDHLMRNADTAMYHAKASGRNQAVFYSAELHAQAEQRQAIERSLRQAVERGELSLHYQPRVDARSLKVLGVEALARWRSAEHGDLLPADFIPIADECGLIVPIGAWLLDQACAQHRAWVHDGTGRIPVSFNLSSAQLHDPGLVDMISDTLARHAMEPAALEIELTENLLMDDAITTVDILTRVRQLGVRLSIDDFGTGFSSLHFLNQFPVDKLKIDLSFARDMVSDPTHLPIIRAIIGLGHALKLTVLAEGVEVPDARRMLAEAGCDELQGFLFARPMAGSAVPAWLARHVEQHVATDDTALGLPAPGGPPVPPRDGVRQLTHG